MKISKYIPILGSLILIIWGICLICLAVINDDTDFTPGPVSWVGWSLTLAPLIGTILLIVGDYNERQK
jgi:hypothetical protein